MSKKFIALLVGVISATALGGTIALAAGTDDVWGPGQANQAWSASSPTTTFTASGVTITCTTNTAGGSSTGANPDAGPLAMDPPMFSNCSDSLGGMDTVTPGGGWTASFVSDAGNMACPPGTGTDENSNAKDCIVIGVPQGGETITVGGAGGCTIIIGATSVGGTLTENSPPGSDSLQFTNVSIPISGGTCGIPGPATWNATYTVAPVGGPYLEDSSGSDDSNGPDGDS